MLVRASLNSPSFISFFCLFELPFSLFVVFPLHSHTSITTVAEKTPVLSSSEMSTTETSSSSLSSSFSFSSPDLPNQAPKDPFASLPSPALPVEGVASAFSSLLSSSSATKIRQKFRAKTVAQSSCSWGCSFEVTIFLLFFWGVNW